MTNTNSVPHVVYRRCACRYNATQYYLIMCDDGYDGNLCGQCIPEFGDMGNKCTQCPAKWCVRGGGGSVLAGSAHAGQTKRMCCMGAWTAAFVSALHKETDLLLSLPPPHTHAPWHLAFFKTMC